jgi:hypothetical protein
MPPPYPLGRTVTFLRPGPPTRDAHGNNVPGPDVPTPVAGCAVYPRTSSENTDRRDQVVIGLTAVMPYGTDVRATDRVKVDGVIYEIDGEPGVHESPLTGAQMGVEVALTRVTG